MVSLIIPTFNRASQLKKTLTSIAEQVASLPFELIIIDNGSNDDTKLVCEAFKTLIKDLVYYYDDMPGLLTGRHKGIELAKNDVLAFLDDDVYLNENYTDTLNKLFYENLDIQFATGPCLPNYEVEAPSWLHYFWDKTETGRYCSWLSLLDLGSKKLKISPLFVFGLNFCTRKGTIIALGGFHPDCIPPHLQQYQGDGETGLAFKAIEQGMTAVYDPGLMLKHEVPKDRITIQYFKKRAFYQGVCNSFTTLRNQRSNEKTKFTIKNVKNKIHLYYSWMKNLKKFTKKSFPEEINRMIQELSASEKDGYNFHRKAFENSSNIKEWVLKENYWDYKLPI